MTHVYTLWDARDYEGIELVSIHLTWGGALRAKGRYCRQLMVAILNEWLWGQKYNLSGRVSAPDFDFRSVVIERTYAEE